MTSSTLTEKSPKERVTLAPTEEQWNRMAVSFVEEGRNPEKSGVIYGTIKFKKQTTSSPVPIYSRRREFVIVDSSNINDTKYLTKQWRLNEPKLVISLVGEYAGSSNEATPAVKIFFRELAKALLSTDAWLTTGGTHFGMTKDVGDALRHCIIGRAMAQRKKVVAIAITPMSVLETMEDELKKVKCKLIDSIRMDPNNPGRPQLDPNHSHYLLINDDGSDPTGVEIEAQNSFLKTIAIKRMEGGRNGVPVISILVGGGHRRIKAIYETVVENKIPVIVLDGSGGAADVIAFANQKYQNGVGNTSPEIDSDVRTKLRSVFESKILKSSYTEMATLCRKIAEMKSLVTILPLNEESRNSGEGTNLEDNILNALLKGSGSLDSTVTGHYADQLHLATVLNRFDLAQRLIQRKKCLKVADVILSLRSALVKDQVEFVRLFLNKGLNLYDYLSKQELTSLYRTINSDCLLFEMLSDEVERTNDSPVQTGVTLKHVGNVIRDLTTGTFKPFYLQDVKFTDNEDRFRHPSHELFLWAVLQGHLDMSLLFWEESQASIAGALLASKLFKEMAVQEANLHETRRLTRYEEGGRVYDELAVEVLSEYYQSDRQLTTLSLVRVLHTWGSTNCLDLAFNAHNMEFIAHPAVQNMLKEFWMGNLSVSNARWKIWTCLAFPPALLCIRLKLKEEESDPLVVKRLPRGQNTGDIKFRRRHLLRTITNSILPRNDQTDANTGPNFIGMPLGEMGSKKRIHMETESRAPLHRRLQAFFFVPLVIFLYNVLSFIVFLGLYSYILLQGFAHGYPSVIERVFLFWFFTLCLELLRQLISQVGPTWRYRFRVWIGYFWNKVDVCKTIIFITGYVLRCFPDTLQAGRILLAMALILFYIRLLHICSANKHLGPILVMIQGMFADLLVFVSILLVFLTAYGVAREAILYPGRAGVSSVLESIFYRPYLQIFGEFLDEREDNGTGCYTYEKYTGNASHPLLTTQRTCGIYAWIGNTLLSIYLFLSVVLLLNLLIAMFNFTFVAVQEKTDLHWKWQRFKLITEYHKRPALAPPFIIISHVILLLRGICKKVGKMRRGCGMCMMCHKRPECDTAVDELAIWESVKGEDYLARKREKELYNSENRLVEISTHVSKIEHQVKEEMATLSAQLKTMQSLLEATAKPPARCDPE